MRKMSKVLMGTSSMLAAGPDEGVEIGVEVVKEAAGVAAIGTSTITRRSLIVLVDYLSVIA
jgi:hypothetical protein